MKYRILILTLISLAAVGSAQRTVKPVIYGKHWIAITGKPLGATAGAIIFSKGGNAVDAACELRRLVEVIPKPRPQRPRPPRAEANRRRRRRSSCEVCDCRRRRRCLSSSASYVVAIV